MSQQRKIFEEESLLCFTFISYVINLILLDYKICRFVKTFRDAKHFLFIILRQLFCHGN